MGVRYVILREFDASKLSHAKSRAFLRIPNLNRDARIPAPKRDRNTPTRDCHITRRVKYKHLRRGLPGRPNDTQELPSSVLGVRDREVPGGPRRPAAARGRGPKREVESDVFHRRLDLARR